ncbi:hypothetical protein [Alteromonas flava]|uniref:hypothetical protein n=1 Tax=Alteromonas flava TaxID=2048003 RepID=UPI000C285748|nr:hypothetical protein [Alteromonas flava]
MRLFKEKFWFLVVALIIFFAMLGIVIQLSIFTGQKIGTLNAKIRSIQSKAEAGMGRGLSLNDYAIAYTESGEKISIRCHSYCKLNTVVEVTIYKPLIGKDLNYVYE